MHLMHEMHGTKSNSLCFRSVPMLGARAQLYGEATPKSMDIPTTYFSMVIQVSHRDLPVLQA
jgi:hypothetical protein